VLPNGDPLVVPHAAGTGIQGRAGDPRARDPWLVAEGQVSAGKAAEILGLASSASSTSCCAAGCPVHTYRTTCARTLRHCGGWMSGQGGASQHRRRAG